MRISDWSSDVCSSDLQDNVKILADAGNSYSQGLKTFANRLAALGQGRGQIPFRILQSKAGRDDLDRWPGRIANRPGEILKCAARRQIGPQRPFVIDQR